MKLLHILPGFDSTMGGTVAFVKSWIESNQDPQIQMDVLALHGNKSSSLSCDSIIKLPASDRTYRYSAKLGIWLEENISNYDAFIIHGIWQYHSYGAWKTLHRFSKPYFVFPHGMMDDWFRRQYRIKHFKKSIYWWLAERKVIRDAQAIFFTSEDEKKSSEHCFSFSTPRQVFPLGIDEPPPNEGSSLFLQKFPDLKDKRILLFLGRIHPKKGLDLLLKAFEQVFQNQEDVVLVLAGPLSSSPYESELQKLVHSLKIASRVVWTGMLEGALKWSALRSSEVFVLPSHQENFGISVAEALACKTPVLITNRINIWREIESSRAGLICDDTLESLSASLREWNSLDASSRVEFRHRARQSYENHFRLKPALNKIHQYIRESLSPEFSMK